MSPALLVVAGEASGDQHGARLLAELKTMVPDLECFGLGGDEMRRQGLDSVGHSREIAVVGFSEVLKVLGKARRLLRAILEQTERRRPAAAVLIDSPGFNLHLARRLRRYGVPVVYYVSPQIWAWRSGRVRTIARRVRKMLVLFPFEVDLYRRHGVAVTHVGHPLVDDVPRLDHVLDDGTARPPRIALLPGSRENEVRALLGAMVEALERIQRRQPLEVVLIEAPTLPPGLLDRLLAPSSLRLQRVSEGRMAALAGCHLALCASGTATLEVGLVGTPMIVLYRVSRFTSLLGRLLLRVPNIGLVNLVLGREVAPELVQGEVRSQRIGELVERLLSNRASLLEMRRALEPLRHKLGDAGASRRAAEEVAAVLQGAA
jgi:lipid-A-disaccharide synthase